MSIKVELISDDKCVLGESPFWDENAKLLYYVDIIDKSVNKYDPSTKKYVKAYVGEKNVSFIIPIDGEKDQFLIGYGNEISKLTWNGNSDKIGNLETVVELKNTDERRHRWNDGKIDPIGRLWAGVFIQQDGGVLVPNAGSLYTLNADKSLKELESKLLLANGLAWNEKLKKFYFVDTRVGEVYEYDYNENSYEISNRKVIFKPSDHAISGAPDGMTIDTDGNLWIAIFGGGRVVKVDPNTPNKVSQTIDIPVPQVTCAEFGGPNYEDLYVTTASFTREEKPPPEGGWTYKVTGLGVRGVPARKVKL